MSNGPCCAIEVCCDPPARRRKTAASIAEFTGGDIAYCLKVLDWMDSEGLVFAPASFTQVAQDVAALVRSHPAESA